MAVYDINGSIASSVMNLTGDEISQAYDIDGTELLGGTLTVMSYNYQWCTGRNTEEVQTIIRDKYNPDIIGIQEAGDQQSQTPVFPTMVETVYAGYNWREISNHRNFNGLISKIRLYDVSDTDYTEYDDEYWSYQKCYIEVGGKRIAWYNTHLTYKTDAATLLRKYAQATELFEDVETEDYAIITGDFNMYGDSLQSADYIGIGKQFADAGYNMANWTADTFVKTWTNSSTATTLDEFTYACDNIICTPNIEITNVVFDTTKLTMGSGSIDHVPVIAYLNIR